jgi:CubicO group peptidase (beta-lactamase class C family)
MREKKKYVFQAECLELRLADTPMASIIKPLITAQVLVLCLILVIGSLALAAGDPIHGLPDERQIASQIEPLLKDGSYLGIVVGIVGPKGRRVFGFGTISRDKMDKPSGDTVFPLASITKTFTGDLLSDFTLRGVVRLDDSIANYLPPGVIKPGKPLSRITLLDLATHTSGLPKMPTNMNSPLTGKSIAPYSVALLYDFLAHYRLPNPPGLEFQYSNIGVALLGHILEIASGVPYEKLVEDRICRPLDMPSTRITPDESMRQRLAQGYDKKLKVVKLQTYDVGKGSGGLYSTGNDMLNYLAANMGLSNAEIVPALLDAQTPRREVPGKENEFVGLAWQVNTVRGRQIVTKNGGLVGFQSFITFSRADKVGIIALANGSPQNRKLDTAARKILWHVLSGLDR